MSRVVGGERRQQGVAEGASAHRRGLRQALGWPQTVEAGGEQALQRQRDSRGRRLPCLAGVLDQLLEEQRVAVGAADDARLVLRGVAGHGGDQGAHLVGGQRLKRDVVDSGSSPGRRELRPESQHQHHARQPHLIDELIDRFARRGVAPVDVLANEEDRLGLRQRQDPLEHPSDEYPAVDALGCAGARQRGTAGGKEPIGEGRQELFRARPQRGETPAELGLSCLAGIGVVETERMGDHLDEGKERRVLMKARTARFQAHRAIANPLPQLMDDPALAEPGLASNQHDLALAVVRLVPPPFEPGQLELAPGERREAGGAGLEPESASRAGDAVLRLPVVPALDGVMGEDVAHQWQHRRADDHRIRLDQGFELGDLVA